MGYRKCPRCELNYILDAEKMCSVCRRELKGEDDRDEVMELCTECGENPAVPGSELCINCLKGLSRRMQDDGTEDTLVENERSLCIENVSDMDEMIELEVPGDIDEDGFAKDPFAEDDEDDEDEEES